MEGRQTKYHIWSHLARANRGEGKNRGRKRRRRRGRGRGRREIRYVFVFELCVIWIPRVLVWRLVAHFLGFCGEITQTLDLLNSCG